jgi:hypothetical protein
MSTNYINVEPEMDENDYMQPNANQPAVYEVGTSLYPLFSLCTGSNDFASRH